MLKWEKSITDLTFNLSLLEQDICVNYLKITCAYVVSYVHQVVLLNQVTTKFTDGSFQLTLALGKLRK